MGTDRGPQGTEVALDRGRKLLEAMPYPDNLDHHFVVDPTKFDFYAMDCYRHLAEDRIAETLADEVIRSSALNVETNLGCPINTSHPLVRQPQLLTSPGLPSLT